MKKIILLALAISMLAGCGYDQRNETGNSQLSYASASLEAARSYGKQILNWAMNSGPTERQRTSYQLTLVQLSNTIFVDGTTHCRSGVAAYVLPHIPGTIHICPMIRNKPRTFLAQVLIHEAAHLAGYKDECSASIVEVNAMRASGVGLQFKSPYWEQCGIR